MKLLRLSLSLLLLASLPAWAAAEDSVSYAKQVKPFLARYCLECHTGERGKAGLDLDSFKGTMAGSRNGPVVVPGKPDESPLVLAAEGKGSPAMPPKKAKQPKPQEVGILRAWVAAGAKDDSANFVAVIPDIKPRVGAAAPVAALAYRPDGKLLAAGTQKEVLLVDVASGDLLGKLPGQLARVTAVAFRGDGQRLAVASAAPASSGEVRLYALPAGGLPTDKPDAVIAAHADVIQDIAFSPDGKLLATCGYDRLIKLWDVATGKEIRVLKDHSDAVYGVTFSPDGKLLASASADRAVKIWDVAAGTRLLTLADATDWLYAVVWSPDGRHVAAAGVDRSIRVWQVSASEGKLVHSVFAHEAPLTRLTYAADGKTLYSVSEDRSVKAWTSESMTERTVYPRQPEAVLSFAVRPDHKQLALGRYDGVAILLDEANGQTQSEPVPIKPKPPQITKLTPNSAVRGQTVRLTVEGKYLDGAAELTTSVAGIKGKVVASAANTAQVDLILPATASPGAVQLTLKTAVGTSGPFPFIVDLFPVLGKIEPNNSPNTGQRITLPTTITGTLSRAGDVDFYRFQAEAGQQVGVQAVTAGTGSKLDPVLQLSDMTGRVLAETTNGVLGHPIDKAGSYALGIRDREYRGSAEMSYRLHVGDVPVITAVFPLGLQRGTEADIHLDGVHLGSSHSMRLKAAPDAAAGTRLPVVIETPYGPAVGAPSVVVGEFPEALPAGNQPALVPTPGTANGRITAPGATDTWRFTAKKGQRLIVEVNARRLGSPLDSFIEILDAAGQPVPRALLRCLTKTYTTFRDHDSAGSGIRIETWNELAINDYLYAGSELLRINALPKNPDDDCQFFSVGGQRVGFLDTTPTHHSMGEPMYKVAIHQPGTTFPPNGFPVFTLFYQNDDGGPGYGKDSRLFFDPPADGDYQVRIGEARGQGGPDYVYRLTVRPPRPSFQVSFNPTTPAVWKGGAVPITVTADRIDSFSGAIAVQLDNLPPGFSAPATMIPAGEMSTAFALYAEPGAAGPAKAPPCKLIARAIIDGQEVVREVAGGVPSVSDAAEIATTVEQPEFTVQPGKEVRVTVTIERRNGFAGRVPLDVRGLPHGVRVLDIGLNGILITEKDTSRTFVIYCEPWVTPMEHPFVVLARSERKNTEHAAKSVLLKVVK
jgi:WD40 repeat protein